MPAPRFARGGFVAAFALRRVILLPILLLAPVSSLADGPPGAGDPHAGEALGKVEFPVGTTGRAQAEFERAVALLHHMTYPQAREAFEGVATLDPNCAMAQWGIAMTLFQPLWPTRPGPEDLQRGWDAVRRARMLGAPTRRESLFIASAEAFFREPESKDYWLRIRRWAQAMDTLYAAYPDDDEVRAFEALSILATAPPSTSTHDHSDRAAAILLRIYEHNPDHPGAMHYLVHVNDVPGREKESLEITRRYEQVAPRNPHALHMPTHIYTRLGDWDGVVRGNLLAAEAALEHPAGERGEWVWDEFPHAIEYLDYAYLQKGQDDSATVQWTRLRSTPSLQPSFKTAFHLSSIPSRVALERQDWAEAAAIEPRTPASLPWDRFAWPEAISRFARGLGSARLGKPDEARASLARLRALEQKMSDAGEELFARNIRVLRLEMEAWIAYAAKDRDSSLAKMREAVALEIATPKHAVTPGPTLPALEQLGDLLVLQHRPAEALAEYRRSLELYPRRLNSLLGAARAAKASGDRAASRRYYDQVLAVAGHATRPRLLDEARKNASRR